MSSLQTGLRYIILTYLNLFSLHSEAEIDNFFQTNNVDHLALVFESKNSYVGREVRLFKGIIHVIIYSPCHSKSGIPSMEQKTKDFD